MRIISGRLKGRRLKPFKAKHLRPTTDRVKESIFNKLMSHWEGARVLDLFAGTGNLSIESFSRGAAQVICVENHKSSLKIIRENLTELGLEQEIQVINKNVFSYLKSFSDAPFDIILVDPPFTEKIADQVMKALPVMQILTDEGCLVIESGTHEPIEVSYEGLYLLEQKDFGDKKVSFFKKRES